MAVDQEPEGFSEEERALFEKLNIGKEGGVPMPSFIRPSDVRSKAAVFSKSIFSSWQMLRQVVERHEATIQRRWAGIKQKKKRKELLLAAAQATEGFSMPEGHRPDIETWRDVREGGSEESLFAAKDPERSAFLWPHLNLEDLSRPEPLLLMLSSRARNQPHVFAAVDLDRARFAMESLALMPYYLNRYTMMFADRTTPESYGELVAWEDLPEDSGQKWLFERRGIHPGEGLWLLEIQSVTYSLMLAVCRRVLHDIPEEKLLDFPVVTATGIEQQAEPQQQQQLQQQAAEYNSLVGIISDEPYVVPPNLDRDLIVRLVEAKFQETKDHLLAMREDPAYFAGVLQDWAVHRREQLLDADGRPHPILAKSPATLWSRVINRAVSSAMLDVAEWAIVQGKLLSLLHILDSHGGQGGLDPSADLPADLAFAFYTLDHHVEQLKGEPFGSIAMGLAASPPMREYFHLVTPESAQDKTLAINAVDTAPSQESTRILIRRLGVVQDEKQRQLVGLPTALDELEYLLHTQPETRHKISPWIARHLATLAVFARILRQVELFQPWAARFGADVQQKDTKAALEADLHRSIAPAARITHHEISERVVALGIPEGGRFDYPVDAGVGKWTAEMAEQVRRAEVALDGFWGRVRVELERSSAMTLSLKEVFSKPLRRSGAKEAPLKKKTDAAKDKNKEKDMAMDTDTDEVQKVKLAKRELKVFNTIFHDPFSTSGQQQKPAEIPWAEFVHAMRAANFTITKLYGSAWLFVPGWGATGKKPFPTCPIMLHEPYTASNKISTTMARAIGRRLAWSYGWEKGTFELV